MLIGTAPSGTLQALGVSNGQLVVAGITSGAIPTLTSLTYIYGVTGQTQSQAVTGIAVNSGLTLPDGLLLLGGSSGLFATSGPGTAITKISSLVDPTIDYVSTVGDANSFVNAGGVAFFTVTTTGPFGVSEIALWTSDGTASGTHIVSTGSGTSQTTDGTDIYDLTALGSEVLFAALDPSTSGDSGSSGLWVTDGSTAGTKEIAAGINPIAISVIGNTAFITGSNGIYTSNGTAAGTAVIATENPVNTPTVLTDTTRIAVTGTHTQYELAPTGAGALQIADTVADRDGFGVYASASIVAFSDGTGVLDPTGNGEAVARLYQAALDRAPDIDGLTGSITALDAGTVSLAQLGNLFVTSPEFLNDYGTLSNSGFVTQLYANALDRAPDPSSFATDVAALNAGLSRGTLLIDIGESF